MASVAPGANNLGVDTFERGQWVVDRQCGDRYQSEWNQAISHGSRLVIVETWNEMYEGESISASREYGRRYIDSTASYIRQWKASPTVMPYVPALTWANLGGQIYPTGVFHDTNFTDGAWLTTRIAGRTAVYSNRASNPPSYQIYLSVDDRFLTSVPQEVWVTVEYLDSGVTPWRLDYVGSKSQFTPTSAVNNQNTGLWKQQTFHLPDAVFRYANGGVYDLRINDGFDRSAPPHYFSHVWITKSPPGGAPQLAALPDITVPPGSSLDIPLGGVDSSGNPLEFALAQSPAFATVNGRPGNQFLHLAPAAVDVRACADVSAPGVTSSPAYTISALATDPDSGLPNISAFQVTVDPAPALNQSAPALSLTAATGLTTLVSTTLTITNTAGTAFLSSISILSQSTGNWLQWTPGPAAPVGTVNLQVTANPAGLADGTYLGTIAINAPGFLQPSLTLPVTLTITQPAQLA